MAFLHGVETQEVESGGRPVQVVRAGVIGLIGTFPLGNPNELVLVNNPTDAAKLGRMIPGFTGPKALDAIYKQGPAAVICVNVYDPTSHNVTETGEAQNVVNGKAKLDYAPLDNLAIENQANEPLTEGLDYEIDDYGNIKFFARALAGVAEQPGIGSFTITGGTSIPSTNKVTSVTIGSTVLTINTDWATSNSQTAADVVSDINALNNADYEASAIGAVVTINTKTGVGAGKNGEPLSVQVGGNVTVGSVSPEITGGVDMLTATTSITADYDRFDPSLVTNGEIIGDIDPLTGDRTGIKCFDLSFNTFGVVPKIFIAPYYSQIVPIKDELLSASNSVKFRGRALIDNAGGMTIAQAIADRGPSGNAFNTSSKRAVLLYPRVKAFDIATNVEEVRPYSMFFAGVWAATANDVSKGYHYSPSNKPILGITGLETPISAALNDESCDANQLNAQGIVTVFAEGASGRRTWGNRSAAFPTDTTPGNFLNVQLTADIIHESLERATLPFIDQPINQAQIDAIRDTVNGFLLTLKGRGAIIDGECTFDPAQNPIEEIAAGHLTFDITFMPPTPSERITYRSFIDINLLRALVPAA